MQWFVHWEGHTIDASKRGRKSQARASGGRTALESSVEVSRRGPSAGASPPGASGRS